MNTFIYRFSILLATCIFLTACGEKAKEAKNAFNNLKNLAESAENMQEELEEQNEKLEERKARGDTVAMNYEDFGRIPAQGYRGLSAGWGSGWQHHQISRFGFRFCGVTTVCQ